MEGADEDMYKPQPTILKDELSKQAQAIVDAIRSDEEGLPICRNGCPCLMHDIICAPDKYLEFTTMLVETLVRSKRECMRRSTPSTEDLDRNAHNLVTNLPRGDGYCIQYTFYLLMAHFEPVARLALDLSCRQTDNFAIFRHYVASTIVMDLTMVPYTKHVSSEYNMQGTVNDISETWDTDGPGFPRASAFVLTFRTNLPRH